MKFDTRIVTGIFLGMVLALKYHAVLVVYTPILVIATVILLLKTVIR